MMRSQNKLQHARGNSTALAIAIIALAIACIVLVTKWSAARDTALMQHADCVVATAKAEGYAGNPHGSEAWQLFSAACAK